MRVMPREMKETGIEWIGEVPKDWDIVKLLFVLEKPITDGPHETPVYVEEGIPFITINNIDDRGNIDKINANRISIEDAIEYNKKAKMKKGDLLFSKSATIGKIAEVDELDFMVWSPFAIIRPNSKILNKNYLKKILSLPRYVNHAIGLGSYNTQVNIGMRDMEKTKIPLPSTEEQKKIADLLDKKCQEIEEIKETIEAEIKTLDEYKKSIITEAVTKGLDKGVEMKDSGIEWIGQIPKHWKIDKVKYNLSRTEERNPGNQQILSVYREYGVIPKDSRDDNHNVTSLDTSNYKFVKPGYLVINKMKAWQGSMGISNYRGVVSPAYYIYKINKDKIYPFYLHNLFRFVYIDEFRRISGGIREGQWDLSAYLFENTYITIPPLEEQKAIAEYLDHKTGAINEAIEGKRAQLVALDEYKKSLIYEYVTGKKEA